ncbi:MAG: MFS transporter [Burkholderiaceae bacterium]|jgi:MFS family permease|nr:MFS transporter [Burkholderiaceae bacterium]
MSRTTAPERLNRTPPAAWRMLALGVAAQAAGTLLVSIPAYLIPLLHTAHDMPLARAGLLAAAPLVGVMLALVAWGALADRFGERWVIAGGMALTSLFAFAATMVDDYVALGVLLACGGAASASTSAASGRVVVGWFPRQRRGLAMGIRQMSQPLGVAVAALAVPALAARYGVWAPLLLAAVVTLVLALACAAGIANPPRPAAAPAQAAARAVNPYARDQFLLRIHAVSMLLVVPQFALSTFGLVWLTSGLNWSTGVAGAVIAAAQFVGALGRIGVGVWSDRVGSRVRVLRWVALSGVAMMLALAATGALNWPVAAAVVLVAATAVSVADNGLAFTSVAEAAGLAWSGKALGIQNTGQFLVAAAVSPVIGALITAAGYPITFALVALTPLMALGLIPQQDQPGTQ